MNHSSEFFLCFFCKDPRGLCFGAVRASVILCSRVLEATLSAPHEHGSVRPGLVCTVHEQHELLFSPAWDQSGTRATRYPLASDWKWRTWACPFPPYPPFLPSCILIEHN